MNLHVPAGVRRAGARRCSRERSSSEELSWGCAGIGTSISCQRPRRRAGDHRRHRRAEADVALAAHRGADPLLVRPHRARRRLGRRADQVDGSPKGRRVRPQRLEDVHHERGLRGLDGRLREDRPGRGTSRHLGLRRPDGHAGRHDREAPRQDGPARDRHLGLLASPTSSSRPRTGSARRATASRSRCRRSTATRPGHGDRRRRRRAGRIRVRVRRTRRSASRSSSRSRCTRASTS